MHNGINININININTFTEGEYRYIRFTAGGKYYNWQRLNWHGFGE